MKTPAIWRQDKRRAAHEFAALTPIPFILIGGIFGAITGGEAVMVICGLIPLAISLWQMIAEQQVSLFALGGEAQMTRLRSHVLMGKPVAVAAYYYRHELYAMDIGIIEVKGGQLCFFGQGQDWAITAQGKQIDESRQTIHRHTPQLSAFASVKRNLLSAGRSTFIRSGDYAILIHEYPAPSMIEATHVRSKIKRWKEDQTPTSQPDVPPPLFAPPTWSPDHPYTRAIQRRPLSALGIGLALIALAALTQQPAAGISFLVTLTALMVAASIIMTAFEQHTLRRMRRRFEEVGLVIQPYEMPELPPPDESGDALPGG